MQLMKAALNTLYCLWKKTPTNSLVLIIVINANRESVINALRSGGMTALESNQLYEVTQALWLGSEVDFEKSSLREWFNENRAVRETSEYDVHLIRVDLSSDDPGLHRDANQLDRLDAFQRLRSTHTKTYVSPRLPSDAYGTNTIYGR